MRRIGTVCCAVLLCLLLSAPAYGAELSISADSAVVLEAQSGRILYEKNAQKVRTMASTTKIMTALLAVESEQLDEVVTVTAEMLKTEGSSIYLHEKDQLTLRSLVYGLMLESGNDAANAIAITVAGSLEKFADRMNRRAAELGMTQTNFVTPSGLDAEGHETTALDMARLAAAAIRNPAFREIASQRSATVEWITPAGRRTFYNHNRLLREMEGCIGIKTGFTKKSGRCLVTACERGGIVLVAVTLNAPDDWDDHQAMMQACFSRVESVVLNPAGLEVCLPVVGAGETDRVCLQEGMPVTAVIPAGRSGEIRMRVETRDFLYAPLKAGDYAGRVVYSLDGETLAEIPLAVSTPVDYIKRKRSVGEQLWHIFLKLFGIAG